MLSPDTSLARGAPVWPLFAKELREIVSGRALWTLLLLACPLVGYSFFQAISLYGEASAAAANSPVLASSLQRYLSPGCYARFRPFRRSSSGRSRGDICLPPRSPRFSQATCSTAC